jgi:hypothetical protein
LDFDGHGPAHRRRLRPIRGPRYDDQATDQDMQPDERVEDSASDVVSSITLALPFETQTCNLCVKEGQGNYIMFNLNNALEHHNIHHHDVQISFLCSRCQKEYRTKHAALCHLPKCPGPAPNLNSGISCKLCHQEFRTQRGLSQHERAAHPALRNEKRQQAAQPAPPRPAAKGHGKTWSKEEIELMIQLELTYGPSTDSKTDVSPFSR